MNTEERIAIALEQIVGRLDQLCRVLDKDSTKNLSIVKNADSLRADIKAKIDQAKKDAANRMQGNDLLNPTVGDVNRIKKEK